MRARDENDRLADAGGSSVIRGDWMPSTGGNP